MYTISENLNLILLNIGFLELNANWNWKRVCSPFARMYYVKDGEARIHINDRIYLLKPHHLYLTPPFTLHDNECEGCFSHFYIHFYEKTTNKESIFDKYDFPVELDAAETDLQLFRRLLDINPDRHLTHLDPDLYDNMPTFSQYIAQSNRMPVQSIIETQGILLQLISKFFGVAKIKSRHQDVRITKCLQFIHENTDKCIAVSQLADMACITEDHLIRIFKKEIKYTPLRYINMKKIEKAQLLLLTTNMPIRDIAFELSIDNISYFNRIFKEYMGKTPTEYRERFNGN